MEDLLRQLGIDDNTFGALPWTLTEPAHLAGAAGGVRPGPIRHTFVKQGQWKDKHVTVTLEGMATNASLPNQIAGDVVPDARGRGRPDPGQRAQQEPPCGASTSACPA